MQQRASRTTKRTGYFARADRVLCAIFNKSRCQRQIYGRLNLPEQCFPELALLAISKSHATILCFHSKNMKDNFDMQICPGNDDDDGDDNWEGTFGPASLWPGQSCFD